jgi:hypothetical protein
MEDTTFYIEPEIRKLNYGGWFAISGKASLLRIGVIGRSEDEARILFSESLKRWKEIHETKEK